MVRVEFDDSAHQWSDSERLLVQTIADESESEVRAAITSLPADITVMAAVAQGPFQVIPETGDGGWSAAPGRVHWSVDATRPGGIEAVARSALRATLLHEFHHLARGWVMSDAEPLMVDTFMNAPISEGMATAFADDLTGIRSPWADYPSDVEAWVEELLALPGNASYAEWMFRHPDGRRWIGYRAGTFLVRRAMNRTDKTAAQLVDVPTRDVLDAAGYPAKH